MVDLHNYQLKSMNVILIFVLIDSCLICYKLKLSTKSFLLQQSALSGQLIFPQRLQEIFGNFPKTSNTITRWR